MFPTLQTFRVTSLSALVAAVILLGALWVGVIVAAHLPAASGTASAAVSFVQPARSLAPSSRADYSPSAGQTFAPVRASTTYESRR